MDVGRLRCLVVWLDEGKKDSEKVAGGEVVCEVGKTAPSPRRSSQMWGEPIKPIPGRMMMARGVPDAVAFTLLRFYAFTTAARPLGPPLQTALCLGGEDLHGCIYS